MITKRGFALGGSCFCEKYIFWRMYIVYCIIYSIYLCPDCCKMLTEGIVNYSEVKNIISVNNNVSISIYSSELQVHL